MSCAASWMRTRWARVSAIVLSTLFFTVTMGLSCPGGDPGPGPGSSRQLFVVNNNISVTSHTSADTANGDVLPATELPAGAATDLFQPRAIAVTKDNMLLVGRQNGGITVHLNASTVTGNKLADRIVDGNQTKLSGPISFAYDKTNDRLYVGDIDASDGVLVFNNVSANTFTGNKAPDRKFNPPDRKPDDISGMTINAMDFDAAGRLYVADTSGLNLNSSRILVFDTPATSTGSTTPVRTLTSTNQLWKVIEDFAIDADGNMYVVDGSANVYVYTNITTANGAIAPARTITISGNGVALRGILIGMNGVGYVADAGNHDVHKITNIKDASVQGSMQGNTVINGSNTGLFTPRQMFIVEP